MKEFDKFIEGLQFLRTLLVEDDSFTSSFPFASNEDCFYINGLDISNVTLEQANRLLQLGFHVTDLFEDENYDNYFTYAKSLFNAASVPLFTWSNFSSKMPTIPLPQYKM